MSRTVKKPEQEAISDLAQIAPRILEEANDVKAGPPVCPIKADHHMSDLPETGIQPEETVPAGEATALVKQAALRMPLTPYNPDPEGRRRLATSIDLSTEAGRLAAYRAATSQDHKADEVIGQLFPVRDWLQHDVQKIDDQTGEIQRWVRTVLITEDGTRISCGSDGVIGSLMSLEAFYGRPPWKPALNISIKQAKARSGRTYSYLDVH